MLYSISWCNLRQKLQLQLDNNLLLLAFMLKERDMSFREILHCFCSFSEFLDFRNTFILNNPVSKNISFLTRNYLSETQFFNSMKLFSLQKKNYKFPSNFTQHFNYFCSFCCCKSLPKEFSFVSLTIANEE